MNSIRIHTSDSTPSEPAGYMVLTFADTERVQLDLAPLGNFARPISSCIALTQEALYELLLGKDLILRYPFGTISLLPRESELIVTLQLLRGETLAEYRVWLAEVALGWNILSKASRLA